MEWQLDNQILAEFTWKQTSDPLVPIDDYTAISAAAKTTYQVDDPILNLYSCPSRTLGDNSLLDLAYFEPWRKCGKELKEVRIQTKHNQTVMTITNQLGVTLGVKKCYT